MDYLTRKEIQHIWPGIVAHDWRQVRAACDDINAKYWLKHGRLGIYDIFVYRDSVTSRLIKLSH